MSLLSIRGGARCGHVAQDNSLLKNGTHWPTVKDIDSRCTVDEVIYRKDASSLSNTRQTI